MLLIGLLSATAPASLALGCSRPPLLRPASRALVLMSAADEEAARRAWLEKNEKTRDSASSSRPEIGADDARMARQREREEARKRMIAAMGGDNEQLASGKGVQYGFGGVDDEDYGYGPDAGKKFRQYYKDEAAGIDQQGGESWFTRGAVKRGDNQRSSGGGFDGRPGGWSRKAEETNPGPPVPKNTLRGPSKANSVPVHHFDFAFDLEPPPQQQQEQGSNGDGGGGAPPRDVDAERRRDAKRRRGGGPRRR